MLFLAARPGGETAAQEGTAAVKTLREIVTEKGLAWPPRDVRIRVVKDVRQLHLFSGQTLLKTYPIALGNEPHLDKEREGDHRTPEGDFTVCTRNDKSRFTLFLGLSYPMPRDAERGLRDKLINETEARAIREAGASKQRPPWNTGLGGEVGIHGAGIGSDWTWGCVALEDSAIRELWEVCPMKTPVTIVWSDTGAPRK